MAHAIQIRTRSVELLNEGHTQEQVAKIMNVGVHSIRRWRDEIEQFGKIRFFYDSTGREASKLPEAELREFFAKNPDALLKEAAAHFNCDPSSVFYACERYRITYKKKQKLYKERNEEKREAFRKIIESLDESDIVYVDEVGIDEHYNRSHGRAPAGERVVGEIPGRAFERTNIVAGLNLKKSVAPFEFKGKTDSGVFEGWFENHLLPAVNAGSVIVLDNASFHRKSVLPELASEKGCTVLYLPAYSPDLNPIETSLWANLKNFLRTYMKFFDSLRDAITEFFRFK